MTWEDELHTMSDEEGGEWTDKPIDDDDTLGANEPKEDEEDDGYTIGDDDLKEDGLEELN